MSYYRHMKILARIAPAFALVLLAVPAVASAAYSIYTDSSGNTQIAFGSGNSLGMFSCGASNICQVALTILGIINNVLVPVIFAFAFIVFLWGVFKAYIWNRDDEGEREKGHKYVWWGIIGFVIMISLWGLVNVVANTFGLGGYSAPPTPTSYAPVNGQSAVTPTYVQQTPAQQAAPGPNQTQPM